jgi:hypothetical protein
MRTTRASAADSSRDIVGWLTPSSAAIAAAGCAPRVRNRASKRTVLVSLMRAIE